MKIEVHHRGATIRYDELRNTWHAEFNGAPLTRGGRKSLADARAVVDKHLEAEEEHKAKFERCPAILIAYGEAPYVVEVTSITDDSAAWISYTRNAHNIETPVRCKVNFTELRESTPENHARLAEMAQIRKEEMTLIQKRCALRDALTPFTI